MKWTVKMMKIFLSKKGFQAPNLLHLNLYNKKVKKNTQILVSMLDANIGAAEPPYHASGVLPRNVLEIHLHWILDCL